MMFAVDWSESAFDEMGRIVMLHSHRKHELAAALREITDRLARDPLNDGESREGDYDRVLVVEPLTVFFAVSEVEDSVEIARVLFVA